MDPVKRSKLHSTAHRAATFVALSVLVAGLIATTLFANMLIKNGSESVQMQLQQQLVSIQGRVAERMSTYNQVLLAGAALWHMNEGFSREDWHGFYENIQLQRQLPYTQGIGVVTILKADEIAAFEEVQRSSGVKNFTLSPVGERDIYTAITYLEPQTSDNLQVLGYDMFSESVRQKAMVIARDEGKPTMSGPVELLQDTHNPGDQRYGILIYYPLYSGGTPETLSEKQAALKGYVYLVLRPADVLQDFINDVAKTGQIGIEVRDVTDATSASTILAATSSQIAPGANTFSDTKVLSFDNRQWQITLTGWLGVTWLFGPISAIVAGIIVSSGISFSIFYALKRRFTGLEQEHEVEVQRTKDELLALTSHQLRTPASGVKQYIGLLKDGIMGELTPAQYDVATKAYEANERQLAIIHELLHVSKVDAGQLVLEPTSINLVTLVERVVEDMSSQADEKRIRVAVKHKKGVPTVVADGRYITMIIENLLSNALKYSKPRTKVNVMLFATSAEVVVSITDKGVGIAEGDQLVIFQKFTRLDNEFSIKEGGSGLGLFLAQRLAEAHGGDIRLSSVVGEGSTFSLTLPLKKSSRIKQVSLRGHMIKKHENPRS